MSLFTILVIFAVGVIILIHFLINRNKDSQSQNNAQSLVEKDAKRFARLTAIEIKLYNEYKLQKGLKNNDIYEALEIEIDEARKKYLKRFNNFFSHSELKEEKLPKYFNEQLVQVLAEGDESKMGLVINSFSEPPTP